MDLTDSFNEMIISIKTGKTTVEDYVNSLLSSAKKVQEEAINQNK